MAVRAGILLLFGAINAAAQIHATPMAGRWFPSEAGALGRDLDESFRSAEQRSGVRTPRRGLTALIVPHAGLRYSGVVAAGAYRLIDRKPRVALVLAFSHNAPVQGVVTVKLDRYESPGGSVPVASEVTRDLGFPVVDEPSVCDHSLENQLPFLRRALPDIAIVPLYVGRMSEAQLAAAAGKLAARVRGGDLLIASSDFTHHGKAYGYTPFPEDDKLPARLRERAEQAFEAIGSLDVATFDRHLESTGDTICGRGPIRLLMATLAAAHGDRVYMTKTDYLTSADIAGSDRALSVGYGALAFYPAASFQVGPAAQRILLDHARATLLAAMGERSATAPALFPAGGFDQRTGAFVTIRKNKELRGCVGTLSPRSGLLATIADRTRAAARSDPRFRPMAAADMPVSLEISLLSPLRLLTRWQSWRPGQGAVLTLGDAGGLLLPQVATEMGWTREQFLEGLSRKAGLAPAAYRDKRAKLYVFEAQVFGE